LSGKDDDGRQEIENLNWTLQLPRWNNKKRRSNVGLRAFDFEPGAIVGVDGRLLCCGWLMRPHWQAVMSKNHLKDEGGSGTR